MSTITLIVNGVDNASGMFGKIAKEEEKLEGSSKSLLSSGLSPISSFLGGALKTAAVGGAAVIGGFGAALVKSVGDAGNFQQKIEDIGSVMQTGAEDTQRLKDLVLGLGIDPKLKVDATQAGDALMALGQAGLSVDQLVGGAARSTVLLSNATGANFADSAATATDVMGLFNIKAEDMQKAVNGIVGVTQSSKFTFTDYALALGSGGKGAVAAGVGFDQFNQILAATANNFTSGQTAGSSITAMLLGLAPRTDKAATLMKDLGIITADGANQFFDINGKMKSNAEIAEIMRNTLGKLNTEQRLQAVNTLFGRDAMAAVNGMIGTTTDKWTSYADKIANTDAEGAAARRMNTWQGAMEIVQGTIDTISIMVGEKFLPRLTDLANKFNEFIGNQAPAITAWAAWFADLLGVLVDQYLPVFIAKLSDWYAVGVNLVGWIAGFMPYLTGLWENVKSIAAPIVELVTHFVSWQDVLVGLGAIVGWISLTALAGLIAAMWPVVAVITAAIGIASAMRHAWETDFGGIREKVGAVLGYLNDTFGGLYTTIKENGGDALREIVAWATGNETQFTAVGKIWDSVKATGRKLFEDLVRVATDTLSGWKDKLLEWGKQAVSWIIDVGPDALRAMGGYIAGLLKSLIEGLPDFSASVLKYATAIVSWIGESLPNAITAFGEWLKGLLTWGDKEGSPGFGGMVVKFIGAMVSKVGPEFVKFSLALGGAMLGIFAAIGKIALDLGLHILKQVGQGLLNLVGLKVDLDSFATQVATNLDGYKTKFTQSARGFMSAMKEGVTELRNDPIGAINGVLDSIIKVFDETAKGGGIKGQLAGWGKAATLKIRDGINQAAQNPQQAMAGILTGIAGAIDTTANNPTMARLMVKGGEIGQVLWSGLQSSGAAGKAAIDAAMDSVIQWVNSMFDQGGQIFNHLWTKGSEIGGAMMDGLGEGIRNAIGTLQGIVKSVVNGVISTLKNALGIASPSKVLRSLMHTGSMGLGLGIRDSLADAQRSMSDVATGMIGSAQTSISNVTNRVNNFNVSLPGTTGAAWRPEEQAVSVAGALSAVYG